MSSNSSSRLPIYISSDSETEEGHHDSGDKSGDDSDTTQLFPLFTSYCNANIRRRARENCLIRHTTVTPPFSYANSCRLRNGQIVRPGDTVELQGRSSSTNSPELSEFLRIRCIIHDMVLNKFIFRGIRLVSTHSMEGALPIRENEYCAILDTADDDHRATMEQGSEEFPSTRAVVKRTLIFTNADHPHTTELVCRYLYITKYKTSELRRTKRSPATEGEFLRVSQDEADEGFRVEDETLFLQWRSLRRETCEPYTFGDAFCGCGGASLGAVFAGIKPKWAFDWCIDAIATIRANLHHDVVYHASAFDFMSLLDQQSEIDNYHQCDILHCSCPCQAFSPANTHGGTAKNDEMNSAASFTIAPLMNKTRPRVCTLEQTFGIKTHHTRWFNAVVNSILSLGCSLRWKIVNFEDYGLPGPRKRLIIFASCPGGVLPKFPQPTHGHVGSGLTPYTTIASCIGDARKEHRSHYHPNREVRRNRNPYDANSQLRHTFTTSGRDNYHPSGSRDFTVYEIAGLQTFPSDFRWPQQQRHTTIKKQIGNSIPPIPWSTFMQAVTFALEGEDRRRGWRG